MPDTWADQEPRWQGYGYDPKLTGGDYRRMFVEWHGYEPEKVIISRGGVLVGPLRKDRQE